MPYVGASPITFISETTHPGKQYQIPLAKIVKTNGSPDASAWAAAVGLTGNDHDKLIPGLLTAALAQGLISFE